LMTHSCCSCFFFYYHGNHRDLHSFPTRRSSDLTIVFDDAPGVAPGTPVRRSGVRIGEVKSVDLDDETGKVRVAIVVEKRYTLRKDRKSTRLNSSHDQISYAVFCLKKKKSEHSTH